MNEHQPGNEAQREPREPIAIVGIGCRLPGGADSPEKLWELLCAEFDAIGPIPADRFDIDHLYDERPATPGRIMSRWGGFLEGIDLFDADFFGMAPREAERLDPQQRLLMEVAYEAAEDAGITSQRLAGSNTGVFVGMWLNDFEARLFANPDQVDFYMTTGSGRYSASGRLSFIFNLLGPSITVDTACSSSLVAVHLACQSIWSGECALAMAGGANVILQPHITIAYSQSRMMAADGRCKFGDAAANGYVRSDGAAMVVLKPLSAALADGNPIYALIRGSAVTNDGRSSGFLATPGQDGQEEMLRRAYEHADIDPRRVQYVEAHGTGTAAGDPVELGALGAVLGAGRPIDQPCLVGSIKTNIGHTEGAAGVTGLIKAALALKHNLIPASLHLREPNPQIPWDDLRLEVCGTPRPLPATGQPAIAGVSSFGIAGTNAHVVLEAAPAALPAAASEEQSSPVILPISANSPEALRSLAQSYRALLADQQVSIADLCYSAGARRNHHRHRLAVVAGSAAEAIEALDRFTAGAAHPGLATGQVAEHAPKIAFVFPGQGSQWPGMTRQLLNDEPVFRATIERCEHAMAPFVNWSLVDQLTTADSQLDQIDVVQPALFAIQVALAALWRSWGVEPAAVVGHSMGEVAAAHVAGVLSLDDAARVICVRSQLLRRIRGQGAMAVVNLSLSEAHAAIADHQESIAVAVSNSPRSTVLSGDPATLERVLEQLRARNIFCRLVKVDVASHSPQVDQLLPELQSALDGIEPQPGALPFYSTVTGTVLDGAAACAALGAGYWLENLRQPVQFGGAVAQLGADGHTAFIELSPHPILLSPVEETLQHHGLAGHTFASMQRDTDERQRMLGSLGGLYTLGHRPNWRALYPAAHVLTALPAYPWQRRRYWLSQTSPRREQAADAGSGNSLLGRRLPPMALMPGAQLWDATHTLDTLAPALRQPLADAEILVGGAYAQLGLEAAAQSQKDTQIQLCNLKVQHDLVLTRDSSYTIQVALAPDSKGTSLRIYGRSGADQQWIEHASGQIAATADRLPTTVDLDAIQARCTSVAVDIPGVVELRQGPGEALGRLRQPQDTGEAANANDLVAGLRLLAELGMALGSGERVLTEIDQVRHDLSATPAWAYARLLEHSADGLAGDISLLDTQGRVVAVASGVRLSAAPADLLERLAQARASDWLYELAWHTCPAPKAERNLTGLLIFADRAGVGAELARLISGEGCKATLIYPGQSFGRAADGSYTVDPASAEDMRRLLAEIRDTQGELGDTAVYMWGLDQGITEDLDGAELLARQRLITGGALLLGQSLISEAGQATRLWLVTRSAVSVEREPVAVEQATLWGLGRVIANEHPEAWGGLIDLEPEPSGSDAAQLLAALRADDGEDQVAIRAAGRLAARLVRAGFVADVPLALRADATYLITGGLGGVGLAIARWMLANGARHIALLGRRPLDQAAAATLRSLEQAGANVVYLQADVMQRRSLSVALSQLAQQMPPLRGVIHAAGILADAALLRQDWSSFEQVLGAKLAGAWNLHRQTEHMQLDLFVLCSSVNAIVGMPGQANYAAANAFLDALAQFRRNRGLAALSINWGRWGEVGLAIHPDRAALLDRRGLVPMAPAHAAATFGRLLNQPSAQIIAADISWQTLLGQLPYGASTALLRELAQAVTVVAAQPSEARNDLLAKLEQLAFADRYAVLLEFVQDSIASVLHFDNAAQVPSDQGFFRIGLDSLTALELRHHLSRGLGTPLSATLAFDYPTAATLAQHLLGVLFPAKPDQAAAQLQDQSELAVLEELTRDDLKALLDAELDAIDL